MKISFDKIKEQLENPFFEARLLGKDAIRQRTSPVDKYGEASDNFQFIEWVKDDQKEVIHYSFADTLIGRLLIADTSKGICYLGFSNNDDDTVIKDMQKRFPQQQFEEKRTILQKIAVDFCNGSHNQIVTLHMKGTDFQIKIWKKLVQIPEGRLSTYGSLAPNAGGAQAIGSAVGANPISYIVPCHRIVKSNGDFHGYHWGSDLKKMLLAYELQI